MAKQDRLRTDIRTRAVVLKQSDVENIQQLLRQGIAKAVVAKEYGVSATTIHGIGWGFYGDTPVWEIVDGRRVIRC